MEEEVNLCVKCKGRGYCGKPCKILAGLREFLPKAKTHFSGSSPPEIFIGRVGYPFVNTGILAPQEQGETEIYSMPELWFEKQASIEQILSFRGRLIYGRFKSRIKAQNISRFSEVMKEIAISSSPVSTEIFLKKPFKKKFNLDSHIPLIGNPAPLKAIRLEENPHIEKKVEYLVEDDDAKANLAIKELYRGKIPVSSIIKVLSAGILGLKTQRRLVPTRWAITATDDTLSKFLLEKIRFYPEISEFLLFHADYLGNHYEFLLLPDKFSFEVIEAKMSGSVWNPAGSLYLAQDYENFEGRKSYADSVTGAYYANRLALCEFLDRIKRQASCLVMRECRPEYYAPCGVGILREASRHAFSKQPERFPTLQEALKKAQERMRLPVSVFHEKSWLLKEHGKQTRISQYF